jgi:hypothetical protein
MINLTFYRFRFAQKGPLWVLLIGFCFTSSAQQKEVVKETLTNKNYANTTEVHKKATASDAEVLSQLEGNYGIGDEVRITVAPPPNVSDSLTKKMAKPLYIKTSFPTIPEGDPPIEVSTKGLDSNAKVPSTDLITEEKAQKSKAFVFEETKNATASTEKKERAVVVKSNKSTTSSNGFYSAKRASRSERFLFFFKKKQSKPKVTYHNRDSSKYGCYKF